MYTIVQKIKIIAFLSLCFGQLVLPAQRPDFLKKDSIASSLDGHREVFYYNKSTLDKPTPLVVELHTWSNSSHSQADLLAQKTLAKNWNYILPNFRGVNNTPKACCSDYVISDIDAVIDWAINHMKVDKKNIHVVGWSGGGYATFAMYMKSKHNISSFSSWCGISDLTTWYTQSVERKNRYGPDIIKCTDAGTMYDESKAKLRSPLYWTTPIDKRKKAKLNIYAGIHDGYTGSVPISQSIEFYNKILTDYKEKNQLKYVSEIDGKIMLSSQSFSPLNKLKTLDSRLVHYSNASRKISIVIFEGGHEILRNVALESMEKK
jgi:predicted peptidase